MTGSANLLRNETSPYLLQHAGNPVHWRPWGTMALAEARETNRPILLSVGYAACHWCHVMAHESFEDAETAELMNRLYVNIKVDREERPDIDHLYMSALQALGEQGGWPLTMFLTPDGVPFWGGTYFPPEPRWGRPSFRQVLQGVAEAWRSDRNAIRQNTAALTQALAALAAPHRGGRIESETIVRIGSALLRATDPERGGLQGAPKFPNPPLFRLLWQEGLRSGQPAYADAVHRLLTRMSLGGIYDHLGGGYARYSTDAQWLAPHFEKMLYDNAQILDLLALAHAGANRAGSGGVVARSAGVPSLAPLYAERADETVSWLVREMTAQPVAGRAGFAASQDADSEGEEGRFYVWTEAEIDALLGAESPAFKAAYDVGPGGNWDGKTILRRMTTPGDTAAEAALARSRARLFAARAHRVPPGRDDKVLADWNGLAVAALCRASSVFDRPDWLRLAGTVFDFIVAEMSAPDGRIQHAWRLGRVTAAGLLEDQAATASAALALFEATGQPHRLDQARRVAEAAIAWFADPHGSYYTTASDAADVPLGPAARPRSAADGATPSGNGLMAAVLSRLFHLTGEPIWGERAEAVLSAFSGNPDALAASPTLLAAADLLESGTSVVIAGEPDLAATKRLLRVALSSPDPAVCVLRATGPGALPPGHPAHGKSAPPGSAAAYVCRGQTCSLPIDDPDMLAALLDRRAAPVTSGATLAGDLTSPSADASMSPVPAPQAQKNGQACPSSRCIPRSAT